MTSIAQWLGHFKTSSSPTAYWIITMKTAKLLLEYIVMMMIVEEISSF